MSTCPTSISKIVGRPFSVPLYWMATARVVVVDMIPNSTPPRHPKSSGFQNLLGSSIPPRPCDILKRQSTSKSTM